MKGEKKILLCVGAAVTAMTVFGWHDTLSIANAKTTPIKREIIIDRSNQEGSEVTRAAYPDFDLEHLSIVGRDVENAREDRADGKDYIPITEHVIGSMDDQIVSETDSTGRGNTEQEETIYEDSEAGDYVEAYESADDSARGNDPGTEPKGFLSGSETFFGVLGDNPDMGDSEYADDASGVDEQGQSNESGLTYLGEWVSTGYCACPICCGQWASGYTASGTWATEGRTVACGSLPMGTQIYIEGYGYRIVEDLGVDGEWVDIFYESHEAASAHGLQYVSVYLVN